jgi:hypothetical protein
MVNSEITQARPASAAVSTTWRSRPSISLSTHPGSGSKSRQNTKNRTVFSPASAMRAKSWATALGSHSVQIRQPAADGW